MTDDFAASLRVIVEALDRLGIRYMVVGSVAALAHGRTRSTQDFDLVVEVERSTVLSLIDSLPSDRFYVSREAALDALARGTLFNVIDMASGWKIDLVPLKRRPFSQREFGRRTRMSVLGADVYVATIEDTIVSKLEWSKLAGGSGRQRDDVRELLGAHAGKLDLAYVEAAVAELGLADEWAAVRT